MVAANYDATTMSPKSEEVSYEVKAFQESVLGRDIATTVDDEHSDRHRQLLSVCVGPSQIYYFEVEIRLVPDENTGICNIADQVLLGNEINQLLYEYGLGQAGADDDAVFHAGVCPQPTTSGRRRKLRLRSNGFIWRGGGGCRYCLWDDFDHRNLQQGVLKNGLLNKFGANKDSENWFTETFAPEMEPTLENAIRDQILPNRTNCLGIDPVIDVTLIEVSLKDLDLACEDGKVIESLQSLNIGDTPLQRNNCGNCASVDFSQTTNGTRLVKGDWIKEQWVDQHGLIISATGGFSPLFQGRIFDTNDTSCATEDGSHDFGSPNERCTGNAGNGTGLGGRPGEKGENCQPIGSK